MKNKYLNNAHISEAKFRKVFKYFASDFDATKCCQLTKLSRKTINKLYHKFRVRIYQIEENQSNKINEEIEID